MKLYAENGQVYFDCTELEDLKVRKWICPECGAELDRDLNASVNILNEGQKLLLTA